MLEDYFIHLVKLKGSDLHLKPGSFPMVRVDGNLSPIENSKVITIEDMSEIEKKLLDDEKKKKYKELKCLDFSYTLEGVGRFRLDIFRQKGNSALAARRIEEEIPEGSGKQLQFKTEIYDNILQAWEEKEKKFKATDSKIYINPFVL